MKAMTKTVKLSPASAEALKRRAKAENKTESELIRQGIELVLANEGGIDMKKRIGPDIGVAEGPPDLSSNRRHLSGYGTTRHR